MPTCCCCFGWRPIDGARETEIPLLGDAGADAHANQPAAVIMEHEAKCTVQRLAIFENATSVQPGPKLTSNI